MAVNWNQWTDQFCAAAQVPHNSQNISFLEGWNDFANTSCRNNPIDLSRSEPGSTNCHKLPGGKTAKNYTSHARAANAFRDQLNSGSYQFLYSYLLGKLDNTKPNIAHAVDDLIEWGSTKYAQVVADAAGVPYPGTGGGSTVHFHKGWDDLRRSVNRRYPRALTDSKKFTDAALRKLAHASRVRL